MFSRCVFFVIRKIEGALWNHSFAVNQFWLILTFWPSNNMIDFLSFFILHSSFIQKAIPQKLTILFSGILMTFIGIRLKCWHYFASSKWNGIDLALIVRTWSIHIYVVTIRKFAIFSFDFALFLFLFEFDVVSITMG